MPEELASLPQTPQIYTEQEKSNPYLSLGTPIIAGGATLGAGKFFNDVKNISKKFDIWNDALGKNRTEIDQLLVGGLNKLTPDQAQRFMDTYINGARGITQSKVLGLRSGSINLKNLQQGAILGKIKDHLGYHLKNKSLFQAIRGIPQVIGDIKNNLNSHAINHYKMYSDPNISLNELRKHHIEEAFHNAGPESAEFLKNVNLPETEGFLKNLLNLYSSKFGPQAAEKIRKEILSNSKTLEGAGTVLRMIGNNRATVLGTSRAYHQTVPTILQKILKGRLPLLAAGSTLSAIKGYQAYDKLKNKTGEDNDLAVDLGVASGVGLGAGITGYNTQRALNPSRNIAVTYGKMNPEYNSWDIGGGHSNPGDALFELLQEAKTKDPSLRKFNLSKIIRNQSGIVDPRQMKPNYNVIADTGLGHFAPFDDPGMNAGKRQHNEFFNHSNARPYYSRVGIMSDLFHSADQSMSGSTFNGLGKGDHILYYGQNSPQLEGMKNRGVNAIRTNKTFTPLILNKALETARDLTPKDIILDDLAKSKPSLADRIKELRGKKIITVSGSGRGDFVGQRAIELSNELESRGIKNVKIIALTASAGANKELRAALANVPHVIPIHGKLDNKTFVGLQRIADMHMGSTGTSSLTESMLQSGGRNVVPAVWGYEYGNYTPNSLADRWKAWLNGEASMPNTDHWNRGNREFAASIPGGLHLEDDPNKIIDFLQDEEALAKSKVDAFNRAKIVNKDIDKGRKAMPKAIFDIAKKNIRRQRIRGALGALAGAGITASSIAAWLAHEKSKKEKLSKTAKSIELSQLIKAKKMSDQKDYVHKNELLRKMLEKNPKAFKVDSHLNRGYVGITHIKSGFKIHAPKHIVPSSLINPQTESV
jgi:hypothetical protein